MENIFAVWKPKGPTSNDVLNVIRKFAGTRHIGHAGTLDPLAEGILVVGIGRDATKKLHEVVQKEKEYLAVIRLGTTSTTDDEEGEKTEHQIVTPPHAGLVEATTHCFEGVYNQIPPVYSAIKVQGEEAYKRVRRGEKVVLQARPAEIKEIAVLSYTWPELRIRVVTGPGVYVRALARDIGDRLSTGGYLTNLVRTRVGEFTKEKSFTLQEIERRFVSKS